MSVKYITNCGPYFLYYKQDFQQKKSINFSKSRILTNDALHLALSIYIILVHNKVLLNTLHVNFRVLHSFENIHYELRTKKIYRSIDLPGLSLSIRSGE